MANNTGTDVASLRQLTTALAHDAIYGREELAMKSLSGHKNTQKTSLAVREVCLGSLSCMKQ